MNQRIKALRKTLNMTLDVFGHRLGVTKSAMSNIENGNRNVTEQMIKSICREFNVDYIWLTSGDGDMFIENDSDMMDIIDRIMVGENEFHKNLLKTFAVLDESELASLESIIDKFLDTKKGD